MVKRLKCPLCDGSDLKEIDIIKSTDIILLWKKRNINVSNLFRGNNFIFKYKCQICGLEFFNPFVSGENKFYSELGKEDLYYLHEDKTEFVYSSQYIKEGDRVLDIGCGCGAFVKYINKQVVYTGLELSSKAVELAQKENINVVKKTIEDFSKENKYSQDVVVTFQVLEHIADIDKFICSVILTLKQDGLFIIAVPNNKSFIRNAQNNLLNLPPHHLLHWDETSLQYIAKKYHLDIVDIYKEKVTNVHKTWYYSTQISNHIRSLLGMSTKSVNRAFFSKIIQIISSLLSRVAKYSSLHSKKDGHTIVIVLKKVSEHP